MGGISTARVLRDIADEVVRAEAKFPGQHLPTGTPPNAERIGLTKATDQARRTADMYRRVCQTKTANGTLTWWDVLAEEFYEAGAEHDPARLRAELIQVAAMALRMVRDIDLGPDRPTVIPPDPTAAPELDSRERKAATGGGPRSLSPSPGKPTRSDPSRSASKSTSPPYAAGPPSATPT
jgi:hypothetical protein